jgi:NAD(P)-dependent dehydrogenase (short-subunit alcohol dehydrogenase family)
VVAGNGGIGYELVLQLIATAGNHVLLGSRSVEKGTAAVQELESKKLPGTVELLILDVADEKSIENAAKQVEEQYGRYGIKLTSTVCSQPDEILPDLTHSSTTQPLLALPTCPFPSKWLCATKPMSLAFSLCAMPSGHFSRSHNKHHAS